MIIKEFRCLDCQTLFESSDADPVCPECTKDEPERVFLTAPSIRSPDTSRKDTIVKELASDYGLSNLSNKEGSAAKRPAIQQGAAAPQFASAGHPVMGTLAKLGSGADNFSGVLPSLQRAGNPRNWNKRQA